MRPYPLSGRKCGAVATTGVIFCSSRVTIGVVESGLRIRGRSNWILLASPASNGGVGEAPKWVRWASGQTGRSGTGSLLVSGAGRGPGEPLLRQPRAAEGRGWSSRLRLS